jgi:integrase
MATPKKLKSGSWRAQVYLGKRDGKPIYASVTAATKAECAFKAAQLKAEGKPAPARSLTVGAVVDQYIARCELLSPTTVDGYKKIRRTMFQDLMPVKLATLDNKVLQGHINAEARRKSRRGTQISPKSVRNAYGLISAALRTEGLSFNVKLPEDLPKFLELPEPEDVIRAVQGTDIELPCMLALWLSLSLSEVRGLRFSSIRNGCIYIDQVVVEVNGRPVEKKNAKVRTRNRCLELPPYLLDLIRRTTDFPLYEAGQISDRYLVPLRGEYQIRRRLNRLVPGITFHQLRHMNASVMLALNVPEKYAMERGGWSTPHTMKAVYQHTFSQERQRVDSVIDAYFAQSLAKISHENTHEG